MSNPVQDLLALVHRRISLVLKVILMVGVVLLLWSQQYQAAMETTLILGITYLPRFLHSRYELRIPYEFESLAILFICLALFFGEVLDFYNRYWWWDLFLHTQSGFLLGVTGFLLVYVLNETDRIQMDLSPGFVALFACMFAIGIGTLWEIFEFCMDQTFGLNMQKSGLVDTMWDLIVDTIGGAVISILGYGYLKTVETDSFLERWIDRFIETNPQLFRKRLARDGAPDSNDL